MSLENDSWRLKFHLMPPQGWMNDPNGLCYFQGRYHVFFQYQPEDAKGGGRHPKVWGHYAGEDLLHLRFEGIPFPCSSLDQNGAYSGSAWIADGKMQLFYTGNIRLAGDYDYIHAGRISNTLRICSEDGVHFKEKTLLLKNSDYPSDCTCHVRDPKVWQEDGSAKPDDSGETDGSGGAEGSDESHGIYHMLLGARLEGDRGAVLLYESRDLSDWIYRTTIEADPQMGYMWECPDYFTLGNYRVLAACPQGVKRGEESFQNVYSSGYYLLREPLMSQEHEDSLRQENYREWDKGFDFYAPQTFRDGAGRRILMGWAGMPDAEYDNPTADLGWQHALTVPRQLLPGENGILQRPVEELKKLRYGQTAIHSEGSFLLEDGSGDLEIEANSQELCQMELQNTWQSDSRELCQSKLRNLRQPELRNSCRSGADWAVSIGEGCRLAYENGLIRLELGEKQGRGRRRRQARIGAFRNARILVDTSLVEIYINDGEWVLTSRFYPAYSGKKEGRKLTIHFGCPGMKITGWQMKAMESRE